MFWVGRLSSEAVAAISLCYPIIFLVISLGIGFSVAGAVFSSQYLGANDQKKINFVGSQTLMMMASVGILFSIIGFYYSGSLVSMMGVDGKVYQYAKEYLEISFIGVPFQYIYLTFQNLLNGLTRVKTPLVIVFISVILNFILDPLFIMTYGLEVKGAAIATILTQFLSSFIAMYILFRGKYGIKIVFKNLKPDFIEIKKIFKLGFPSSLESSARSLSMMLMTFLVAGFGTKVVAIFGIGIRILSFVIIPAMGFSQATSSLVGKNIGSKNYAKAKIISSIALKMIFIFLTLIGVVFYIFSDSAVSIFMPNDPVVIYEGSLFIKIIALTFGFVGLQQVAGGAFRGGGSTALAMILAVLSLWLFRLPLAYVLSKNTSLSELGLWWAIAISNTLAGIVAIYLMKYRPWIKNLILEKNTQGIPIESIN